MCNIEKIKNALYSHDANKANDLMCELLKDPEVTIYDAFENLCRAYMEGSEEFRNGMNKAMQVLLWKNMEEVTDKVIEVKQYAII